MSKFNLATRLYIGLMVLLALLVAVLCLRLTTDSSFQPADVILLLILTTLAEGYELALTRNYTVTAVPTVHIAAIFLLPPPLVILVATLAIVAERSVKRVGFYKGVFNTAHRVIITGLPALILEMTRQRAEFHQVKEPLTFALALVLIGAYYLLDISLVDLVIALSNRDSFWRLWKVNNRHTLLLDLSLPSLGIVMAIVWLQSPVFCLLLIFPVAVNHFAFRSLKRVENETHLAIISITELVEARDPYTFGHSLRVSSYCRAIATELGLDDELVERIALAGRVHDLGKIGVRDSILQKDGPLTREEWVEMRRHSETGARILANYSFYREGVTDVLYHHESWDGTGYPAGLEAERIPLGARIIAVADSFDAMTTDRPYRAAMPAEKAIKILKERRQVQWDTRAVNAFLNVLHDPARHPEVIQVLPEAVAAYLKDHHAPAPVLQNPEFGTVTG